ncbi:MAG: MnhB domain-containing protein [bacterium]
MSIKELSRDDSLGMTVIVKTIARLVMSFIILFGCYIILYGHITPGGGFAGGVIIAIAYVLLMLSFGGKVAMGKLSNFWASMWDNIGALAFVVLGFLGMTGGYFFLNFINHGTPGNLISGGIIPLANISIAVKVGAALYAIFIGLSVYGRIVTEEEK